MEALLVFANALIVLFVAVLIIMRSRRKARSEAQNLGKLQELQMIPPEGIDVAITQTFSGIKALGGGFGFSHNNLNPKLTLYNDRIEYRVIFKGEKRYSDIERIKIRGKRQVQFDFTNTLLTLSVWLPKSEDRPILLKFLRSRGVELDEKASESVGR